MSVRVLVLTVSVPLLSMPPPLKAVLPDRVLPLTVSVRLVGDAAAVVGGVAGQGAAADRQRAVVGDAAAVGVGGVAGQGAAALTVSVAVVVEMPPPA